MDKYLELCRLFETVNNKFRTPLDNINGALSELSTLNQSEDSAFFTEIARDSVTKLIDDFNMVIMYNQVISETSEVHPERIEINRLLEPLVTRFQVMAEAKNLEFELKSTPPKAHIQCDIQKVRQLLTCLLDNAIRFTAEGKVCLHFMLTDTIQFSITDTGSGLNDSVRRQLNLLNGSETKWSHNQPTLGIGLPLSFSLVQLLDGTMDINNNAGSGTSISIRLPHNSPAEQHPQVKHKKSDSGTTKTILVVEDNSITLYYLETILKRNGYMVLTAEDGDEAIQAHLLKSADLILLDIGLPKKSGIEVAEYIRKTPKYQKTDIIILTAFLNKDDMNRYRQIGCKAVVEKPIDQVQLLSTIKSVLED